ncbi:hypothetical protein AB0K48_27235 [Nonomuraea sp. NPDC055795]
MREPYRRARAEKSAMPAAATGRASGATELRLPAPQIAAVGLGLFYVEWMPRP